MKQILLELDDDTAARLDVVAPAQGRKRSDFIRKAIRQALLEAEDLATELAYRRHPDSEPIHFDAGAWEVHDPPARLRKSPRPKTKR